MEETYEKISDTEAKVISTTTEESIVSIEQLHNQLKQLDDEINHRQQMIEQQLNRINTARQLVLDRIEKMKGIGIVVPETETVSETV